MNANPKFQPFFYDEAQRCWQMSSNSKRNMLDNHICIKYNLGNCTTTGYCPENRRHVCGLKGCEEWHSGKDAHGDEKDGYWNNPLNWNGNDNESRNDKGKKSGGKGGKGGTKGNKYNNDNYDNKNAPPRKDTLSTTYADVAAEPAAATDDRTPPPPPAKGGKGGKSQPRHDTGWGNNG